MPGTPTTYQFEGFELDPARRQLVAPDGELVAVRTKVFDLLVYLVAHAGRLVTKTELLQAIWPRAVVEENNLNQAVSTLRQALGDDRHSPRFIATVTGQGYQFVAPVTAGYAPAGASTSAGESSKAPWPAAAGILAAAVLLVLGAVLLRNPPASSADGGAGNETAGALPPAALGTDFPGAHSSPTLSPDATLMAFVSDASGIDQIWVKRVAGGEAVQITHGDRPARYPAWSPRNDAILFQRTTGDGSIAIWSVDPLGSTEPRVLVDRGVTPSYSWDGDAIVYAIGRQIWVANADGSNRRRIDGVPLGPGFESRRSPALSPDGKTIAFIHATAGPAGNIWLVSTEGGDARQLAGPRDSAPGIFAQDPSFSADGRYVVYSGPFGSVPNTHLWRIPVDGGDPEQLTSGVGGYGEPDLSRDGGTLVYSNLRPVSKLIRTDIESLEHSPIFESRNSITEPTVSADGRQVVYFSETNSHMQIFTIDVEGEQRRQWTFDETAHNILPSWSGDLRWLYFYQTSTSGAPSLRRIASPDASSEQVLEDFSFTNRHWLIGHGELIAFREFGIEPDTVKTLLHDVAEGTIRELPATFSPTQWSRDGGTILGFSQERASFRNLFVCELSQDACRVLQDGEEPIIGFEPHFSSDESKVFFRRNTDDREFDEIWIVDLDGSNARMLFRFGPIDVDGSASGYGVTDDDDIIWNQFDTSGTSEIWNVRYDD